MDPITADGYFCDKTLLPGQGHGPLAHPHDVVTLVLHGRLNEAFDGETQRCSRWQLHFKPAGTLHATSTGPDGVRMFMIGVRGAEREGLDLPSRPTVLGGGVPAIRALRAFLPHTDFRNRWTRVGREAILQLIECLEPPAGATPTDRPTWVTEVHELLGREDEQRRSMASMSAMFHCHPGSLARAFRRHYGVSISAFRRRTRVERAIDRLIDGDGSLADLAHELGYADQSHLTREFRYETGWAPGRLRAAVADWGRLHRFETHLG